MRYSEPLILQVETVLVFFGVGFLLGVFYLICMFFRQLLAHKKAATVILDLLFCFVAFFVLFSCLLAYTNGVWRLPALGSTCAGFFLFRFSLGRILEKPVRRLADLISQSASAFFRPVRVCSTWLSAHFQHLKKASSERACRIRSALTSMHRNSNKKMSRKKKKIDKKHLKINK